MAERIHSARRILGVENFPQIMNDENVCKMYRSHLFNYSVNLSGQNYLQIFQLRRTGLTRQAVAEFKPELYLACSLLQFRTDCICFKPDEL